MSLCRNNNDIEGLMISFDTVELTQTKKDVTKSRYLSILKEYDLRSSRYSYAFHSLRIIVSVGSLLVPAILSVQYNSSFESQKVEIYWLVWILSLFVTMSNGIINLFKVDKKYYSLNTTYHHLTSEGWQFIELTGRYSGKKPRDEESVIPTHENQYRTFTHSLEKIRMKQVEEEYYKVNDHSHGTHGDDIVPKTPFKTPDSRDIKSPIELNGRQGDEETGQHTTVFKSEKNTKAGWPAASSETRSVDE